MDGCEEDLMSSFSLHCADRKDGSSPYRGRSKSFRPKKTKVAANGAKPSGRLSKMAKLMALLSFKLSDLAAAITTGHGASQGTNLQPEALGLIEGKFNQVDHLLERVKTEVGQDAYTSFTDVTSWSGGRGS